MVIDDAVRKRMERIEECLKRLEDKRKLSLEKFLKDLDVQDVVLRNMQIMIEACLDIGSHLISLKNWQVPETYADIPKILAQNKVIPFDFAARLASKAKFRNIIVHEYTSIDLNKVYKNLQEIDDIRSFVKYAKDFLVKEAK